MRTSQGLPPRQVGSRCRPDRGSESVALLKICTVGRMKKIVTAASVVVSLFAVTGCIGSDVENDSPPPAGGINGPAIVDPDVEIGPVDDPGG